LRRGRLHRLRRGAADAGLPRRKRHRAGAVAHRVVGLADGDLCLCHPCHPPVAPGSPARPRGGGAGGTRNRDPRHENDAMISLQWIYWLTGGYVAWVALLGSRDRGNPRRWASALFWGLLAL